MHYREVTSEAVGCGKIIKNPYASDAENGWKRVGRKLAEKAEAVGNYYTTDGIWASPTAVSLGYDSEINENAGAFQWFEFVGAEADADRVMMKYARSTGEDARADTALEYFTESSKNVRVARKGKDAFVKELIDMRLRDIDSAIKDEEPAFNKKEASGIMGMQHPFQVSADLLKKATAKVWGKKESEQVPTQTRYVKYSHGYKDRTQVDFESGKVVVETVSDDRKAEENLKKAVVTTLMTPADPRSVDLFSDRDVEGKGKPYMSGLVRDHENRPVSSPEDAERYADYLVKNRLRKRTVETESGPKEVRYVEFEMISDHLDKRAREYEPIVSKHSEANNLSKSLVFAVMKTESAFNPFAVSPVPAYGLMQLVPKSGGARCLQEGEGG